jgi:predicted phage-related endonuclease
MHISSQESRFIGVNVNGRINANAPHGCLTYQISSYEVDWKALVNVRVELKELNTVFSQVWPTLRHSRKYLPVKVK